MTRTKTLLVTLLLASACNASAQSEPASSFEDIFRVISAKNVFFTSFRDLLKKMSPLCTERHQGNPDYDRKGNVNCVAKAGVTNFTMSGSESPAVTMINATFTGSEKCAQLRAALVKQYGKPAESQGRCNSKWLVKRGKDLPLVYIALEDDAQENLVYFRNQEEQGP